MTVVLSVTDCAVLCLLGHLHAHLRHPHSWVWLTTAQVFGQLFAAHKPEELLEQWSLSQEDSTSSPAMPVATTFLYSSLDKKVGLCVCVRVCLRVYT